MEPTRFFSCHSRPLDFATWAEFPRLATPGVPSSRQSETFTSGTSEDLSVAPTQELGTSRATKSTNENFPDLNDDPPLL